MCSPSTTSHNSFFVPSQKPRAEPDRAPAVSSASSRDPGISHSILLRGFKRVPDSVYRGPLGFPARRAKLITGSQTPDGAIRANLNPASAPIRNPGVPHMGMNRARRAGVDRYDEPRQARRPGRISASGFGTHDVLPRIGAVHSAPRGAFAGRAEYAGRDSGCLMTPIRST